MRSPEPSNGPEPAAYSRTIGTISSGYSPTASR